MMIMMDIMNNNRRMDTMLNSNRAMEVVVVVEEGIDPSRSHVVAEEEEDKVEGKKRRENIIQEEVHRRQRMQSLAKYGHPKMPNKRQKPRRLRSKRWKCQKCELIAPKRVFMPEKPLLQIDLLPFICVDNECVVQP